jgi:lipopolysaccharide transport system ATP-binding protein
MSDIAIRVEGLSKQYRIGRRESYRALRDTLTDAIQAPFRAAASRLNSTKAQSAAEAAESYIWALKDVSFEVKHGEVVGIIGRNGAGKSTLLKILSRITKPTEGYAAMYGRIGSLLEVGTGFHPELTGRENIYLNGSILGMKKVEIERRFDEIVAFAEIEKFLDTPVKRYSSGMYVRLAFAVAAHLEPEILVIDEVLAVGDFAFQQKCIKKIGHVAKSGHTVLLVSHNLSILNEVAESAIWLDQGHILESGQVEPVIRSYLATGLGNTGYWHIEAQPRDAPAYIYQMKVTQGDQEITGGIMIDKPFEVELEYTLCQSMQFCRVGFLLSNAMGTVIFSTAEPDDDLVSPANRAPGNYRSKCTVPGWLLAPGSYVVTLHIDDAPLHRLFTAEHASSFEVIENVLRGVAHHTRPGVVAPKLPWIVEPNQPYGK